MFRIFYPIFSSSITPQQSALTSTQDLREDAALVGRVDLVRGLALLVGSIQQAAIFGVTKQLLGNAFALSTQTDV